MLVDDRTIRWLNRRYRRVDRATDVLAFPIEARQGGLLGDVVVSVDRARVQARAVGHTLQTEVALLAVHGVLHLRGYDDLSRAAALTMTRRQQKLLAERGYKVSA